MSRKDSVPLTFTVGGRGSNCVLWLCLCGRPPPSPSSQHRRGGKFRICEGSILCPLGSLGGSNPIIYQALDHNRGSRDFNPSSWISSSLFLLHPKDVPNSQMLRTVSLGSVSPLAVPHLPWESNYTGHLRWGWECRC